MLQAAVKPGGEVGGRAVIFVVLPPLPQQAAVVALVPHPTRQTLAQAAPVLEGRHGRLAEADHTGDQFSVIPTLEVVQCGAAVGGQGSGFIGVGCQRDQGLGLGQGLAKAWQVVGRITAGHDQAVDFPGPQLALQRQQLAIVALLLQAGPCQVKRRSVVSEQGIQVVYAHLHAEILQPADHQSVAAVGLQIGGGLLESLSRRPRERGRLARDHLDHGVQGLGHFPRRQPCPAVRARARQGHARLELPVAGHVTRFRIAPGAIALGVFNHRAPGAEEVSLKGDDAARGGEVETGQNAHSVGRLVGVEIRGPRQGVVGHMAAIGAGAQEPVQDAQGAGSVQRAAQDTHLAAGRLGRRQHLAQTLVGLTPGERSAFFFHRADAL